MTNGKLRPTGPDDQCRAGLGRMSAGGDSASPIEDEGLAGGDLRSELGRGGDHGGGAHAEGRGGRRDADAQCNAGGVPTGRHSSCREARDLDQAATRWPQGMRIAVNVSPVQFRYAGFLDTVRSVLAETALDPTRLELEVTEGILMHDTDDTLVALAELPSGRLHAASRARLSAEA